MQVLAGILDANAERYETDTLLDDVLYLARSLGFAAFKTADHRITLHGIGLDKIPIKHRLFTSTTEDALVTPIRVEELPINEYYGFEIDGNRRFLLGDFTVTHNTVMGLYIATQIGKKTLVICHKDFLINQWRERIEMFVPNAKVGLIKAKTVDTEGCDIVLASIQSLAMKEYDPKIFQPFGFVIGDECHHLSAEVFSRALPKVSTKIMLGLSATLNRKDGLRKVFEWFLGRPVYETKKRLDTEMIIKVVPYYDPHPDYGRERKLWNGKLNFAQMLNGICSYKPRNDLIIQELKAVIESDKNRRVLILSDRRNHLKELDRRIRLDKIATVGFYVGGMKEEQLKESESKEILLATFSMAAEAMDVPHLNTLILASPVSAIEQPIGRIQRQKANERKCVPYTIDIWDQFSIFERQGTRRIEFYKKNGYQIEGVSTCEKEEEPDYNFIKDSDDENV